MSNTKLVATSGRPTGSANARRLRTEGRIPAVLYGGGMEPVSLTVERRDLRIALSGPSGSNAVLDLAVDGTEYLAVVKDIQRHPVKRTVSHVDFLRVAADQQVTVRVPLHLSGESKAAQAVDGLVDAAVDSIEVSCTPGNIPAEIVVDITDLEVGQVIRLGDVRLPAGVSATGDADMALVSIIHGSPEAPAESGTEAAPEE